MNYDENGFRIDNFFPSSYEEAQNNLYFSLPKPSKETVKALHEIEDEYPQYFDRESYLHNLKYALRYASKEEYTAIKTAEVKLLHLIEKVLYKDEVPCDYMIPDNINVDPDSLEKIWEVMSKDDIIHMRKVLMERNHLTNKETLFLLGTAASQEDFKRSLEKVKSVRCSTN